MAKSCPECKADVVYAAHAGTILIGHCDACGETLTLLSGSPQVIDPNAPVVAEAPHGRKHGGKVEAAAGPALECQSCDGPMTVRWNPDNNLETTCPSCNLTVTYLAEGSPGYRPPMVEAPRGRQWEPAERGSTDRGAPPMRTARPCRQCGAPLRFSTAPDGTVQGECSACGNRFSMAPRPDGPRGGGGRGDRRSFGGPPRRGGFGGSRGPPRSGPPGTRRFSPRGPPRERRDDDDDEGGDRRRRRPRRE